ncbi:MAG: HIT family protein [archaeon]
MAKQYDENCIFCKFIQKKIDVATVLENEYVLAFLDNSPAGTLTGHTLVIPKKHFVEIEDIEDKYIKEIALALKKLAPAIKKVSGAEGINLIQNNGKAAGQFVMHAHFHLIPRKAGDGIRIDQNRRNPAPLEQVETANAIKETLLENKQN